MKNFKKAVAVIMVAILLVSCLIIPASAKNVCSKIDGKTDRNGGVSTTFYVTASDKKKHSVTMKMKKGQFRSDDSVLCVLEPVHKNIYDYYEILVYGKKADGSYVRLSKTNVKNKGNYTISFSGYKNYKIKIYSWKTDTINKVGKHWVNLATKAPYGNCEWKKVPTWEIRKTSGITLCK